MGVGKHERRTALPGGDNAGVTGVVVAIVEKAGVGAFGMGEMDGDGSGCSGKMREALGSATRVA